MIKYIDAHTHAHFAAYENDYREVISGALAEGVALINVGTERSTSKRAVEVAHEFKDAPVYATVGVHPSHALGGFHDISELGEKYKDISLGGESIKDDYYLNLARDPKVVAIGECGLDYFRIEGDKEKIKSAQKDLFLRQIAIAREVDKPLMIHCREAFSDLIPILKAEKLPSRPGIIHFFTGTIEEAGELLDLGFSFTFGGVLTFVRAYDEIVKFIPMEKIMSETDAPYVTPEPFRGKRNEPLYVVYVAKQIAKIKDIREEDCEDKILRNAEKMFGISLT